jgi:hypothetical protein
MLFAVHGQADHGVGAIGGHGDGWRSVSDGVVEQVGDDLFEAGRVGPYPQLCVDVGAQRRVGESRGRPVAGDEVGE